MCIFSRTLQEGIEPNNEYWSYFFAAECVLVPVLKVSSIFQLLLYLQCQEVALQVVAVQHPLQLVDREEEEEEEAVVIGEVTTEDGTLAQTGAPLTVPKQAQLPLARELPTRPVVGRKLCRRDERNAV